MQAQHFMYQAQNKLTLMTSSGQFFSNIRMIPERTAEDVKQPLCTDYSRSPKLVPLTKRWVWLSAQLANGSRCPANTATV